MKKQRTLLNGLIPVIIILLIICAGTIIGVIFSGMENARLQKACISKGHKILTEESSNYLYTCIECDKIHRYCYQGKNCIKHDKWGKCIERKEVWERVQNE